MFIWYDYKMTEEVAKKVENFFAGYKLRSYAKGQILLLSGDTTDYVYHLIKGSVKEYDVTYRGEEIILNIFKPPAFFPMSLAINKGDNAYIYEAETAIEIRQAPAEEVVSFIQTNPDVMYDLLSRLYMGVDGLLGRMAHLMGSSAKSRIIYELILEARRFGTLAEDGSCLLNINEKGLGARAGLSRETINRELHKLKEENLVAIQGRAILIKNLSGIEAKLGREV